MKKKSTIVLLIIFVIVFIIACVKIWNNGNNKDSDQTIINSEITYKESITVELGNQVPNYKNYVLSGTVYSNQKLKYKNKDGDFINLSNMEIDCYDVYLENDEKISTLCIQDTKPPILNLKDLTIKKGESYEINDFVASCLDNSNVECTYDYLKEEFASYKNPGEYSIEIEAKDVSANSITGTAKLTIEESNINKPSNSSPNTVQTTKPTESTKPSTNTSPEPIKPIVEVSYKYGTKITKTTSPNGNISYEYDFTSFSATTNDLLVEAIEKASANLSIYNEVLKYTNAYREELMINTLVLDSNLNKAATIRAIEIAYSDKFSHTRPNGTTCFTVLSECGVSDYYTYGENIAYGYNFNYTPAGVTEGWRNSPGHYANMVNASYTSLGVGYYKLGQKSYYVQLFGG